MRNYIRKSFKRELLFCFILVAILPLIISSFFMIRIFKINIEMATQKEITIQLDNIEEILVEYFYELEVISQELQQNDLIIKSLCENDDQNPIKVHQALLTSTSELRKVAQFELYSRGGVCKYSTSTKTLNTTLPTYWGILKAATGKLDSLIIHIEKDYADTSKDVLVRTAKSIVDKSGNCIGYIVIRIKSEHFSNLLDSKNNLQDSIFILDRHWNTIYSKGPKQDESVGLLLREQLMKSEDINNFLKERNIYISSLGDTGLYLVLQRDQLITSDISKTMYNVSAIMTLLSLVLCAGVSLKLSKSLFKPIHIITEAMHKIQEGNLDTQIETGRMDEFGKLAINFNIMVSKLRNYMEYKVKKQQELNESNIAMMQAQLNPHFVYNTLDTIKWVAKANDIPEIVILVTGLAKILRSSISTNQLITLKQELTTVQSYMDIQHLRFSDKFKYTTDIPKELETLIVPKLIIQPLVENAIIHGLSDREEGHIHITAYKESNKLRIIVSDDGCGINKEVIEVLNNRSGKKLEGGIGIYNIDTIIRLHFGDEFGVYFKSIENSGTTATVLLPVIL